MFRQLSERNRSIRCPVTTLDSNTASSSPLSIVGGMTEGGASGGEGSRAGSPLTHRFIFDEAEGGLTRPALCVTPPAVVTSTSSTTTTHIPGCNVSLLGIISLAN